MRRGFVLAALLALPVLATGPAAAGGDSAENDQVVLTGEVLIEADRTAGTVVIFDGPATVLGTVRDSLVAFNGDVLIEGRVDEDVVAFNGAVTVASGGSIGGDLVTRQAPVVQGTVQGEVRQETFNVLREPFPFVARLILWVAMSASLLVLGLLFVLVWPGAADATERVWRTAMGPAIGWGLILLVLLPVAAVLSFVTLVGIPLGFVVLMALGLVYAVGYANAGWILGRRIIRGPQMRMLALLVGLGILRLVALVPVLAGIVGLLASAFGLGAVAVASWRAARPAPTEA